MYVSGSTAIPRRRWRCPDRCRRTTCVRDRASRRASASMSRRYEIGQRLNEADLVHHHQPIDAGDLDAHRERRPNRHQERRTAGTRRRSTASVKIVRIFRRSRLRQTSGRNFMHAASVQQCPCRGAASACARSAACGSCVTMTIVLPWSRLSVCSRSRISSPALRSRSPVGSSQSSSVGSVTIARAMPTRCSWPPESCRG